MTLHPPLWAQNTTYPAFADRLLLGAAFQPGVIDVEHLQVKQRAQGTAMTVEVQGGTCVIPGASGNYVCHSDAIESRDITPAPIGADRRYDLVVARVYDSQATGVGTEDAHWDIEVVTGTASTAPTVPEVPDHAIPLAALNVTSGLVAITDAQIIERRPTAQRGSRGVIGRTVRTGDWTVGSASLFEFIYIDDVTVLGRRWVRCTAEPHAISSATAGNAVDTYIQINQAIADVTHMRHRVAVAGGPGQENRAADGVVVLDPGAYRVAMAARMSPSGQTILVAPIELTVVDLGEAPAGVPADFTPAGLP